MELGYEPGEKQMELGCEPGLMAIATR